MTFDFSDDLKKRIELAVMFELEADWENWSDETKRSFGHAKAQNLFHRAILLTIEKVKGLEAMG